MTSDNENDPEKRAEELSIEDDDTPPIQKMASEDDRFSEMPVEDVVSVDADVVDDDFDDDLGDPSYDDVEDDFGDDHGGFGFEEEKSGGLKKLLVPALVLVMAGGIGAYIVLNPGILGGSTDAMVPAVPQQQQAASLSPEISQEPAVVFDSGTEKELFPDMSSEPDFTMPFDDGGELPPAPQPVVNEEPPEEIIQDDLFAVQETDPMAEVAVVEDVSGVPEVPEEIVAVEEVTILEEPIAPVVPEEMSGAEQLETDIAEVAEVNDIPVPEMPQGDVENVSDMAGNMIESNADQSTSNSAPMMTKVEDTFPDVTGQNNPAPFGEAVESGTASAPVAGSGRIEGPDVYYDAQLNVPTGPLSTTVGPRKINPVQEPASKYVVARKIHRESDPEAMVVAASRALKLGRYDAALEMYDGLYAKNKRDQRILMGRAVALQNTGRPDAAIHAYEEVLDIAPDNADALVNMLGLIRQQYPEVALRRLINLFQDHPNNAGIAAQIGVTEAELGNTGEALRYLGMAASMEPTNAQHQFNMAVIADRAGQHGQALKLYEEALEVDAIHGGGRSVPREQIYDRLSTLRRH